MITALTTGSRGLRSVGPIALAVALLLALSVALSPPAHAVDLDVQLGCPDTVNSGEQVELDLLVVNQGCSETTVRIMASMVGNGNNSARGVAIIGPEIVGSEVTIPAAQDQLSGVCSLNQCEGSNLFCFSDEDCRCREVNPIGVALDLTVPTPVPEAFDQTIMEQLVLTNAPAEGFTQANECRIAVPEPDIGLLHLLAAAVVLALHGLARTRSVREIQS